MRTRAGNQSLGADGIVNASFLSALAPGTPFMATEFGFAEHAADPKAPRSGRSGRPRHPQGRGESGRTLYCRNELDPSRAYRTIDVENAIR